MSDARTPGQLHRITVNLTPTGSDALTAAAERLRLNQTDTVDRALRVYDWLTAAGSYGAKVVIHYQDGETERVQFV